MNSAAFDETGGVTQCKCWHWLPYPIVDGNASERINFSTQAAIGTIAMA